MHGMGVVTAPTAIQLSVLVAVEASVRTRGAPPTTRELAAFFGWRSSRAAGDHLDYLRRKGLLESEPMRARALRVTEAGLRALGEWREFVGEWRCDRCGAAYFGDGCPGCRKAER